MVSNTWQLGRRPPGHWGGNSQWHNWPSLRASWWGCWGPLLLSRDGGSLRCSLSLCWFGWSHSFCCHLWSYYLTFFVLLGYTGPSARESWLSLCFCLCPVIICQPFQLQVWDVWGKKETQGTYHRVVLGIQSPWLSALFSPSFRVVLCLFL